MPSLLCKRFIPNHIIIADVTIEFWELVITWEQAILHPRRKHIYVCLKREDAL